MVGMGVIPEIFYQELKVIVIPNLIGDPDFFFILL